MTTMLGLCCSCAAAGTLATNAAASAANQLSEMVRTMLMLHPQCQRLRVRTGGPAISRVARELGDLHIRAVTGPQESIESGRDFPDPWRCNMSEVGQSRHIWTRALLAARPLLLR